MHTESTRIDKSIIVVIIMVVGLVAIIANGAAYLGGTAFVRDVMGQSETIAYIFGGVLEMILAVLSLTVLAQSRRLAPTAGVRIGLWVAAAASAAFGAAHEIHAWATGVMTLFEAIPSAAWRISAVIASVALWELVVSLVCGPRARQAREAERQHQIMYRYLKRVQWVGLTQGTRFAGLARIMERYARMQTAKHVTPEQRTAILEKFHEAQEAAAVISVAMASLAQTTNDALKDLGDISSPPLPAPVSPVSRASITTTIPTATPDASSDANSDALHVQTVQPASNVVQEAETYTRTAAATVAASSRAIRADLKAASPTAERKLSERAYKAACIELIRETWSNRDDVTQTMAHEALRAAGYNDHKARSTGNYLREAFQA